jgi:hypothetical protein
MNTEPATRPKSRGTKPLALTRSWLLDDPRASIPERSEQNGQQTACSVGTNRKRSAQKCCVRLTEARY